MINGLGEIVKAVIPVLILAEVVHWTDKLTAAVMFFIGVVVTSLTAMFIRAQTVTHETANRQIAIAVEQPSGTSVQDVIKIAQTGTGDGR